MKTLGAEVKETKGNKVALITRKLSGKRKGYVRFGEFNVRSESIYQKKGKEN